LLPFARFGQEMASASFFGRVLFAALLVSVVFADSPTAIIKRALSVVNHSKSEYLSNQVLNYAINGNKNVGGNCAAYRAWGMACTSIKMASVLIANDGSNCAIAISPALIEYTSGSKGMVVLANAANSKAIFPMGYIVRCYVNGTNPAPQPNPNPNPNPQPNPNNSSVAAIVQRALAIVGQPSSAYLSNQILNYAINGNKNVGGNCASWRTWGVRCASVQPASIAIAKDGSNCAIWTTPQIFEYTSGSKHMVVQAMTSNIKFVFPMGYDTRCHP